MKPPSTWPRSTSGDSESPTSCRMSTRSRRYWPVKPSTSTSLDGGAVGEVVKRLAGARSRGRSGCRACGSSRSPTAAPARGRRPRRSRRTAAPRSRRAPDDTTRPSAKTIVLGAAGEALRRHLGQALAQGVAGGAHGGAVEIGAARRRGGRGVGHLVGARRHHADRGRAAGPARRRRSAASWCAAPGPSRCRRGSPARCRPCRSAPARRPGCKNAVVNEMPNFTGVMRQTALAVRAQLR